MSAWDVMFTILAVLGGVFVVILFISIIGSILDGKVDGTAGRSAGHNAHDSNCVKWMGDFAGVDLKARCLVCDPDD